MPKEQNNQTLRDQLSAPFESTELKWKAQIVSGNRALAVAYVDARAVMDRLDSVFGVGGWQTSFREVKDGIVCRLEVRAGGGWSVHEDVGGESEQKDEGDRQKAAFSDALKRVAVHLGIGRYLYRLPPQWCDYDPQKKQILNPPRHSAAAAPAPVPAPSAAQVTAPAAGPARATTGKEFADGVRTAERKLVLAGRCRAGELVEFLTFQGRKMKHPETLADWGPPHWKRARVWLRVFQASHPEGGKMKDHDKKIGVKQVRETLDLLSGLGYHDNAQVANKLEAVFGEARDVNQLTQGELRFLLEQLQPEVEKREQEDERERGEERAAIQEG